MTEGSYFNFHTFWVTIRAHMQPYSLVNFQLLKKCVKDAKQRIEVVESSVEGQTSHIDECYLLLSASTNTILNNK